SSWWYVAGFVSAPARTLPSWPSALARHACKINAMSGHEGHLPAWVDSACPRPPQLALPGVAGVGVRACAGGRQASATLHATTSWGKSVGVGGLRPAAEA